MKIKIIIIILGSQFSHALKINFAFWNGRDGTPVLIIITSNLKNDYQILQHKTNINNLPM